MDLRRGLLLGLILLPGMAAAAGKCERLVVTGSPDAPPYLWQDPQNPKHLIGASADLLQQVAKDLGIKVELLYAGKRAQALDEVRSGRMDMLADTPLMFNELENLDYIYPPLLENDYLVWTRKGSTLVYSEARDLHGHTGGLSEKSRMTQAFGTFAEQNLTLTRTANITQAFQKLLLVKWNMYSPVATRAWPPRRHWVWPMICWRSSNRSTDRDCSSRFRTTRPATIRGCADSSQKR